MMWALLLLGLGDAISLDVASCEASSNGDFCSFAFDRNLSSAWASTGPAPQWVEGRIAGGAYVALGSYSIISVTGHIWYEGTPAIRNLGGGNDGKLRVDY
eukprot:Skav220854  [mRNA]  locus=scaffold1888:570786:574411:- [translate_table: standard]